MTKPEREDRKPAILHANGGTAARLPASPARRWFRFGLAGVDLVAGPRLEH